MALISSATMAEIPMAMPKTWKALMAAAVIPCFLPGRSSRLPRVLRRAMAIVERVSHGSMTSVM
jgi:hypothetical protein